MAVGCQPEMNGLGSRFRSARITVEGEPNAGPVAHDSAMERCPWEPPWQVRSVVRLGPEPCRGCRSGLTFSKFLQSEGCKLY